MSSLLLYQYSFSSLPYEIYLNILSFGANLDIFSEPQDRKVEIVFVANFQSLNSKINSLPEMKKYFDEFWWKVLGIYLGNSEIVFKDLKKLKLEMIEKNELKRKIILTLFIKFNMRGSKCYIDNARFFNVYVCGDSRVGKSSLVLTNNPEKSYTKTLMVDHARVSLDIADPSGAYSFEYMRQEFLKYADSFIIVSSVKSADSLNELLEIAKQLKELKSRPFNDTPIVFVINMIDLLNDDSNRSQIIADYRTVIEKLIIEFEFLNTSIIETSSKTGLNVELVFEQVSRLSMNGSYENVEILQQVIENEGDFVKLIQKNRKNASVRKCQLM